MEAGAFKRWLDEKKSKKELILLDGSFSHELEKTLDFKDHIGWTAYANFDFIDKVQGVHEEYINMGCDIITSNTYHHSLRLLSDDYNTDRVKKAFEAAVNAAHLARLAQNNEEDVRLLVSIGPYGINLRDGSEYTGAYAATVKPEEINDYYDQQIAMVKNAAYNGVIFETIPTKIDVETIISKCGVLHDVIVSLSLNKLNLRDGTPLKDVVNLMMECEHIIAVSINCSDPQDGVDQIKEIVDCGWLSMGRHIFIYPNSGEPWVDGVGSKDGDKDEELAMITDYIGFDADALLQYCPPTRNPATVFSRDLTDIAHL